MSIESTLGSMSFKGTLEGLWRYSQPDYLKLLSRVLLVCISELLQNCLQSSVQLLAMRMLSPIRSLSPGPKPKVVFNYQPSPLRERPSVGNVGNGQRMTVMPVSPIIKTYNLQPVSQVASEAKCVACPKQATYRVLKDSRLLCSTCAIGIMSKGLDVVRIELREQKFYKDFHQRNDKENERQETITPKVGQFCQGKPNNRLREAELDGLLKNITKEQEEMSELLAKLNSEGFTTQGIKGIYHDKKLALKKHYEKIKAAIKLSIEKDLQELDRRQQTSLRCVQQKKEQLREDIFLLQKIRQDIEPNKKEIMTVVDEADYQQMLKQHRQDSQTVLQNKVFSVKLIKELTSHQLNHPQSSQQVRLTQEQLQSPKSQLYDPFTYTMINTKQNKGQTLFSFQKS